MIQYDDRNLRLLIKELDLKKRAKVLRGVFRQEANRVKKVAINNLRASDLRTPPEIFKGVRAVVFKRVPRFSVTVAARASKKGRGEYGMHRNRYGKKKPVLVFAELGSSSERKKRSGKRTGRIRRYGFIAKTRKQVVGTVTNSLHEKVIRKYTQLAKKYGCK